MFLILYVALLFLLKIKSGQLQCVKGTVKDSEFSIIVKTHLQVVSGDCIVIPFEIIFPKNKVKVPYKRIWFRGDPQNTVSLTVVKNKENSTKDILRIDGLPQGEYEYGFKLEWECNQMYVFPKRVRVSVSALTRKPTVLVPPLKEGQKSTMRCYAPRLCSARAKIEWKTTNTSKNTYLDYTLFSMWQDELDLNLIPSAYDHNTANITCVVEYENNILAERTITLTVQFAPKFKNGSQCMVKGKLLVCECISWGNPTSSITWPVSSLTDFSINTYSNAQTVNSILTMNAADFFNTSVRCISSNALGLREIAIPIKNYTGNSVNLNEKETCKVSLPWIIAVGVSVSLTLVLLISLIICFYKRGKRSQEKLCEEMMNTYASLNRAQIEQDYSVISPQLR
ncbi:sialic acid-binding Ig-like lectin 11 [Notolabrus celidotus]|uniref:sialic acid-binding Ig-like lectin 11 n=1 Tax=Notolabrus celidotus TaxID=1203425 RepID=UPI00148FF649|nr:sialic acid-binding Ig-like lectin 11 [Notolabrus celidotus]XP_034541982.1 sialic acid-binding Ig-like lectin 11 [Notolabrus celidotus]